MIQIDMPMPTNCLDCPACNEYLMCAIPVNGREWGENDVREFGQGRPEWCPMKEQEAVESILIGKEGNPLSFVVCGNCSEPLYGRMNINYCAHCGRKVKWDG